MEQRAMWDLLVSFSILPKSNPPPKRVNRIGPSDRHADKRTNKNGWNETERSLTMMDERRPQQRRHWLPLHRRKPDAATVPVGDYSMEKNDQVSNGDSDGQQHRIGESSGRTLRRELQIAWLSLSLSVLLSYLVYGHTFYSAFPSSYSINQRRRFHDAAIAAGKDFFRQSSHPTHRTSRDSRIGQHTSSVCVAITTRKRRVPYIQASIASLLTSITNNDGEENIDRTSNKSRNNTGQQDVGHTLPSFSVHILNTQFPLADNTDLAAIRRFGNTSNTGEDSGNVRVTVHDVETRPHSNQVHNANRNYARLLRLCLDDHQHHSDWILALEEDVVVTRDFWPKLGMLFQQDTTRLQRAAVTKLFWSDRWDGFSNDEILELAAFIGAISAVLVMVLEWLTWKRGPWKRPTPERICHRYNQTRVRAMIFRFGWISVVLTINLLLVGKQNWEMLWEHVTTPGTLFGHRGRQARLVPLTNSHHQAHGQAMLFSREAADRVCEYLAPKRQTNGNGDNIKSNEKVYFDVLLAREYLKELEGQQQEQQQEQEVEALLVSPPLVQHIGVYSSFVGKNQGNFAWLGMNERFQL